MERNEIVKGLRALNIVESWPDKREFYVQGATAAEYQAIVAAAAAELTPRVLALNEIAEHDGALYVEDRIRMSVYPVLYIAEHRPDTRMATWWGIESYEQDGYGDWWRCWTRRPTPEDMALTPWTVATDEGGAV